MLIHRAPQASPIALEAPTIRCQARIPLRGALTQTPAITSTSRANPAKKCVLQEPTTPARAQHQIAIVWPPRPAIIRQRQVKPTKRLVRRARSSPTPIRQHALMQAKDGTPTAPVTRLLRLVQAEPTTLTRHHHRPRTASWWNPDTTLRWLETAHPCRAHQEPTNHWRVKPVVLMRTRVITSRVMVKQTKRRASPAPTRTSPVRVGALMQTLVSM